MLTRPDTLRDQAYVLIRDRILTQDFAFGEHLSVAALSREFGISNSPIREAISLLVTEGLVVSLPNQGFAVIELDEFVFTEIAQSILVLLSGCYDYLLGSGKAAELVHTLSDRLNLQRSYKKPAASYDYACCVINFDRAFVELCGNSMLSRMFDSKFNLLVLCTMQVYSERFENITENLMEHTAIYAAVAAGQHEQVHYLLARHFNKHKPA